MDKSIISAFVNAFTSPDGFYSLWGVSKAEVVLALVGKYGKPPRLITIENVEKLIAENTIVATPSQKERVAFAEAGVHFNFTGNFFDVSSLPGEVVVELEKIKESKSKGYVYMKREYKLPIAQDCEAGAK